MAIRPATAADTARLMDLWQAAGLRFHPDLGWDQAAPALALLREL